MSLSWERGHGRTGLLVLGIGLLWGAETGWGQQDLAVTGVSLSQASGLAGSRVDVTYTVKNVGNLPVSPTTCPPTAFCIGAPVFLDTGLAN